VNVAAESASIVETGAAAVLFAAVFLWGGRLQPLRAIGVERRSVISFSAGMAAAYVFVHVMPEMHGARQAFAESASIELRYEGMAIYFVALVGFLVFYGLNHLRSRLRAAAESEGDSEGEGGAEDFWLDVGGFAAYVALVGYLLVRSLEETPVSTSLYAVAFGFHFLGVDHSLREEHGEAYEKVGRYLLAAMALIGWGVGLGLALPPYIVALLVAFVSGAIIMNSAIMELPAEKDGRFVPFMVGGLLYGLILLPLG
jgi:hypothetical protein